MPGEPSRKNNRDMWTACAVFCVVAVLVFVVESDSTSNVREDVLFRFFPSAERAYKYGTLHFDATHPDDYDIDRAEYFFQQAFVLDAEYPYVRHQRARISFLKSDFASAIEHINGEIANNPNRSSYYVRGLVKGYMDDYSGAAADYEAYLREDPSNWAALNDYAWVLLQADRPLDALTAIDWGLMSWPDNPWLLNSRSIAHFELGQLEQAEEAAGEALRATMNVTEGEWRVAYPGNDPLIATEGVMALRSAVQENVHTISLAIENEP